MKTPVPGSPSNKFLNWGRATLLNKNPRHRRFHVNFVIFLGTPI